MVVCDTWYVPSFPNILFSTSSFPIYIEGDWRLWGQSCSYVPLICKPGSIYGHTYEPNSNVDQRLVLLKYWMLSTEFRMTSYSGIHCIDQYVLSPPQLRPCRSAVATSRSNLVPADPSTIPHKLNPSPLTLTPPLLTLSRTLIAPTAFVTSATSPCGPHAITSTPDRGSSSSRIARINVGNVGRR